MIYNCRMIAIINLYDKVDNMDYIINRRFMGESFSYDLINGKFVNDSEKFDLDVKYEDLVNSENYLKESNDFMCITIAVTDACNLNCSYCFEKHGNVFLNEECIKLIGRLISGYKKQNNRVKRIVIIWFGGEPILNLKFILEASEYIKGICKQLNLEYSARIITNGVALDKMLQYIEMLNITDVQITLDGLKEFHDLRRATFNGNGSFEKIVSNILKIDVKVDLIIRVNVDKNNMQQCKELYEYILELPFNSNVNVFFQPMLVENYGGESTCYEGLVLEDKTFNEEYLDLLEYVNLLQSPRYIKAFCNVAFPGSIVIKPNGALCKCWAEVVSDKSDKISINSGIEDILHFMKTNKRYSSRKECKRCIIYPTCLGGCMFRNYTSKECEIKRANVSSMIERIFVNEKAKTDIKFGILKNELIWLRSIGCKVKYQDKGIEVSRDTLKTSDFNFFIGDALDKTCIRLSNNMKEFQKNEKKLLDAGYKKELNYDINYIYYNLEKIDSGSEYEFKEIEVENWKVDKEIRLANIYTRFYNIKFNECVIGKFSVVVTDIIGIYDYEIFDLYRGMGHGINVLKSISLETDKNLFIQTWSDNCIARKCYESAGFIEKERLYRYYK